MTDIAPERYAVFHISSPTVRVMISRPFDFEYQAEDYKAHQPSDLRLEVMVCSGRIGG